MLRRVATDPKLAAHIARGIVGGRASQPEIITGRPEPEAAVPQPVISSDLRPNNLKNRLSVKDESKKSGPKDARHRAVSKAERGEKVSKARHAKSSSPPRDKKVNFERSQSRESARTSRGPVLPLRE